MNELNDNAEDDITRIIGTIEREMATSDVIKNFEEKMQNEIGIIVDEIKQLPKSEDMKQPIASSGNSDNNNNNFKTTLKESCFEFVMCIFCFFMIFCVIHK